MATNDPPISGPGSAWRQGGGGETGGGAATGRAKYVKPPAPTGGDSGQSDMSDFLNEAEQMRLLDVVDNPLQNYQNTSYSVRLTMMHASESTVARTGRSYDYTKGIVMWDTGATGTVYLDTLEQQIWAPGNSSANYMSNNSGTFTGTLVEPIGGRFFEMVSIAALSLEYSAPASAVFLLEVSFTGYDKDDMPIVCKGFNEEELTFRWYVSLNELKMKLDNKGAVYDFKLQSSDGNGVHADFYNFETSLNMPSSPATVGDFCRDLADALNKREQEKVTAGIRCYPHKYVITPHKEIANIKFSYKVLDRAAMFFLGRGEMQAKPGTTIEQFINSSLGTSTELLKYLHRVNDGKKEFNSPDTKKNSSDKPAYSLAIMHGTKTIKKGNLPLFDNKKKSFAYEVHYFVFAKPSAKTAISHIEFEDAFEPRQRQARVNMWIRLGMIRKAYKWIYTGENTEVLNADIKLDNLWRIVKPLWIDESSGRPVTVMGTQKPSQITGGKKGVAAIICNETKRVDPQGIFKGDTLYAEDLPYRSGAQNNPDIRPHEGWYPHMPEFYHMNVAVNEQTSQSQFMAEGSQEFSVFRQIANIQGQGTADHLSMNMEVVGDPYWLMQIPGPKGTPPWEDDVWGWEENHWTQEQLAEKRKRTGTVSWLPFIYFEAQAPAADWTTNDLMNLRRLDAVTGVFASKKITNKFIKGKFTTYLELFRDGQSSGWTIGESSGIGKASKVTPSKSGTGNSTGPNNAAPTWQPDKKK